MDFPHSDPLDVARRATGLSQSELWMRYFALGGMADAMSVEAVVVGLVLTTPDERDRIVHALNERFAELGRDDRVAYSDDDLTDPV
ncbi:MAG: hypothetical protein QOG49_650 [Frankiaceae bacterium]|nr:hypothetical protein [Frankiaceae bacterium]